MAKHQKNKAVSKGQRISCKPLTKAPARAPGTSQDNAICTGFLGAAFPDSVRFSRLGAAIIKCIQAPVKRSFDEQRGWSAKLSFRTFNSLKEQGILS